MNLIDIRSQLEEEMTWRWNEIRFFRNMLFYITDSDQKDCYRKALIVMLYSHYEGFCKTALGIYADYINSENLRIQEVNNYIAACSMDRVFKAYENKDIKCTIFKKELPEDRKLHRFARQVDFIESFSKFNEQIAIITEDVIDTESNLKYVVLKKMLYRLGLDWEIFKKFESSIEMLLGRRNNIAHGSHKTGISEEIYNEVEEGAKEIMEGLLEVIMEALSSKQYTK